MIYYIIIIYILYMLEHPRHPRISPVNPTSKNVVPLLALSSSLEGPRQWELRCAAETQLGRNYPPVN